MLRVSVWATMHAVIPKIQFDTKLGIKTISFVPFAIRSGWCNQTFSIALFPKGFSILMQSSGLFVTFTSISLRPDACAKMMKLMRLFSRVMRIRIVCVFSLLVSHQKQTLSIISVRRGNGELKDSGSDCLIAFEGQNLMNLSNNTGFFRWHQIERGGWLKQAHSHTCRTFTSESTRNFPCHCFNFESFNMSAKWVFMYAVKVFPGKIYK